MPRQSVAPHVLTFAVLLCCADPLQQASRAADNVAPRRLNLRLVDSETMKPVSGIIRVSRADGAHVQIPELISRKNGWHTVSAEATFNVPAEVLKIEALRGIETELSTATIGPDSPSDITVKLKQFFSAQENGWRNGNTHLHLMNLTRTEAERYLREVPESDDLELVYLSHLRRLPDESKYISNEIVEEAWTKNTLRRLSTKSVLLRPGEEHRHNFGRGGEGFGHVMLLDINRLVRPVSIGPGIMRSGTDSQPLQKGIDEAHADGATVIWCHNTFGFEDIPNWVSGKLHAQNIFDGGNRGSYADSFYRYLNLGMRMPFSTGTDWFIDDFSRVYVPLRGNLTSEAWLTQLRAGRSFITNGPLLQLEVDGKDIGHTFQLEEPQEVRVTASGFGRRDFEKLELILNGEVVETSTTTSKNGHFNAVLKATVQIDEPSWLAVRTPPDGKKNEFDVPLYSHTSPVYFDLQGRRPFRRETALLLIQEMEESLQVIREKAVFANDREDKAVMDVYRKGILLLQNRVRASSR